MGTFRVIHYTQFHIYHVRRALSNTKICIAFCIRSGDEWTATNIMHQSPREGDIIKYVRLCKTMNEDFVKRMNS